MLPSTSNVALMTRPAELAGRTDIVRDGAVFRNIATGQIEGHMVEMARVPSQALQYVGGLSSVLNLGVSLVSFAYMRTQFNALNRRLEQIEKKIDKLDQKLDVLIGMVHRVDRKVDGVARALASMTSKIDARHCDQVFAEIGAVLDTLVYADKKSPAEAKDMVASNITPARKAIRLFNALIEEFEANLSEGDIGFAETTRMRFMSGLLSIKIDLALDETENAKDQAIQLSNEIRERSSHLLGCYLNTMPIMKLGQGMEPLQFASMCGQMEVIDGMPVVQRMAQVITNSFVPEPQPKSPEQHLDSRRLYMASDYRNSNSQSCLLMPGVNLIGFPAVLEDWHIELPLKVGVGETVAKGSVIARIFRLNLGDKVDMTGELLSPVDGVLVENHFTQNAESAPIRTDTTICRISMSLPTTAETSASKESVPEDTDRASVIDAIETLSHVVAAANGTALETVVFFEHGSKMSLPALAQPFQEDCILVSEESLLTST